MVSAKDYRDLLERSVRGQEQSNVAIKNQTKVTEALGDSLKAMNGSISSLNDNVHSNLDVVKDHLIKTIDEQKSVMYKLAIALFIAVGGASVLKLMGVF